MVFFNKISANLSLTKNFYHFDKTKNFYIDLDTNKQCDFGAKVYPSQKI